MHSPTCLLSPKLSKENIEERPLGGNISNQISEIECGSGEGKYVFGETSTGLRFREQLSWSLSKVKTFLEGKKLSHHPFLHSPFMFVLLKTNNKVNYSNEEVLSKPSVTDKRSCNYFPNLSAFSLKRN